jgi:N-acetyl-anhydromuramyl-L-alanine amidase AmpD
MGSPRRILLLCAVALCVVSPAHAAPALHPPAVTWLPTVEKNFTPAHRRTRQIKLIVVHVTEGPFAGSVAWLRNPASHASANFVVSRTGKIAQLVAKHDIAWHAGNWRVNEESIGIEHVGITGDPSGFTRAEYRASARLAAYVARTSLIPINRRHFIGHAQVRDPDDPLAGGGIDNHTDPGPFWNWPYYLRLVRAFAYPKPPKPPVRLGIASTTLYDGQIVAGTVPWRAHTKGPVTRVDFLVDGRVRRSDRRAPFAFTGGWRTSHMGNGRHALELRAFSGRGSWTRHRLTVRVHNLPFVVRAAGVRPHASVAGVVPVRALLTGALPRRVELFLDGREIDHDTSKPYAFRWDSRRAANGPHVLELRAVAADARVAQVVVPVLAANVSVALQSPAEAATVSGVVPVQLQLAGDVRRVDLLVDGVARGTATAAPWSLAWDTSGDSPGLHLVTVVAHGAGGAEATSSVGAVVAAPAG